MNRPFPAYKGDQPYLFVSYAHDDAALVFPELERLRALGYNVWYDEGIQPGASWRDEIANAIHHAMGVVFYVTGTSATSEYCTNEVHFAIDRRKPFLAVYLQPTQLPAGLELSISGRQAIMPETFQSSTFGEKFSNALQGLLANDGLNLTLEPASHILPDNSFDTVLAQIEDLVMAETRVSYRALKRKFRLDDDFLEDIKEELIRVKRIASDEDGHVLVARSKSTPTTAEPQTKTATPDSRSERRRLHFVTCLMANAHQLAQHLDPELVGEAFRPFVDMCREAILQSGGQILDAGQDQVIGYFGYPTSHDDEAFRAVTAAQLAADAASELEIEEQVVNYRIGIHSGLSVVSSTQGVVTETHRLATRLAENAADQTILISENTFRSLRTPIRVEPCKDIANVHVYRVLDSSQPTTIFGSSRLTGLVGRTSELELMQSKWELAQSGRGQVIMISGEPAIGKSRLVHELVQGIDSSSATLLEFRCSPFQQNTSFGPIISRLENRLGFNELPDDEARKERLLTNFGGFDSIDALEAEALSALFNLPADIPADVSPSELKEITHSALLDLLEELSIRQPLLCTWEDLHWADGSTLALLGDFLQSLQGSRVLCLFTFRPEFVPPWRSMSHVVQIPLDRLPTADVIKMIRDLAGNDLSDSVVVDIANRTDGVPLFAEELTKAVVEHQDLDRNSQFDIRGIPDTLTDSLMARLDRLGPAKKVAQCAAVLGREFTRELIDAAYDGDPDTIEPALNELIYAELLYRQGPASRATYFFKHALVQNVAYESLVLADRKQYHGAVADAIVERFPAIRTSQPELVAYHYGNSNDEIKAVPYWQQAGTNALKKAANLDAISHFEASIAVIRKHGDETHDQYELQSQLGLAPAYMAIEGWAAKDVEVASRRAVELCTKLNDGESMYIALWALWTNYFLRGQQTEALQTAEQVYAIAQAAGQPMLDITAAHALGFTHYFMGNFKQALSLAEEGIAKFDRELEDVITSNFQLSSSVVLLEFAAHSAWNLGFIAKAIAYDKRLHELIDELDHKPTTAQAKAFNIFYRHFLGDLDTAEAHAGSILALAHEEAFQLWAPLAQQWRGWVDIMRDRTTDGIRDIEEGIAGWEATGTNLCVPQSKIALAECLRKLGQFDKALRVIDEYAPVMYKHAEQHMEAEYFRVRGLLLADQGDREGAVACMKQAIDVAIRQEARTLELRARTSLLEIYQHQDQPDRDELQSAKESLITTLRWFDEGDTLGGHRIQEQELADSILL